MTCLVTWIGVAFEVGFSLCVACDENRDMLLFVGWWPEKGDCKGVEDDTEPRNNGLGVGTLDGIGIGPGGRTF